VEASKPGFGARGPSIETERLVLRAHRPADLPDCAALWGDPAVTRYIGGRPFTREQTWHKILRYAGLWSVLGYGYWAIEEKATRRFAGELGFADFKRDIDPSFADVPEIGWALAVFAQHRGFASEAVRAAVAWSDAEIAAARTMALIAPDNAASIRIASANGYRKIGTLSLAGAAVAVFGRPAGLRASALPLEKLT
jgi:RimJ/RimL family protein N-acetyltransferase